MRQLIAGAATIVALLASPTVAPGQASPLSRLRNVFAKQLNAAGGANGAYVLDLTNGKALYASQKTIGRLPASVEKIYTTTTALLRFGPRARLQTTIYGTGKLAPNGIWQGNLYLRGEGDPTFGSRSFDASAYGSGNGATMQQLVSSLVRRLGIKALAGRVIGDESYFDSLRGTAPNGYQVDPYIGGPLSALEYDRGLADAQGTAFQGQPALFTARQLVGALRADGVRVRGGSAAAGRTPASATELTSIGSPTISNLIQLTNTPSDNLFAEMLLKGLGARFGGAGSSAAGSAVVKAQLAALGVHPRLEDGSGLSRRDVSSPVQVVTVLQDMAAMPDFVRSLAIAGQTGTLAGRMSGTAADGRCHAKTGTLYDVSALAGYCMAHDQHLLAFAILQNAVDPTAARPLQDQMAIALARYNG